MKLDNSMVNKFLQGAIVFTKAEADEFINMLKNYNHQ